MPSPLRDIVHKFPMPLVKATASNDNEGNEGDFDNINGLSYAPSKLN